MILVRRGYMIGGKQLLQIFIYISLHKLMID